MAFAVLIQSFILCCANLFPDGSLRNSQLVKKFPHHAGHLRGAGQENRLSLQRAAGLFEEIPREGSTLVSAPFFLGQEAMQF